MRCKEGFLLLLCFVALLQTGCEKEAAIAISQAPSSAEVAYFGTEYEAPQAEEFSAEPEQAVTSAFDSEDDLTEDTENTLAPPVQERITLEGKNILFFGDSLFSGKDETDAPWTWANRFDEACGSSSTIIARHGATITASIFPFYIPGGSFDPMVIRPLPELEFDIVFLTGGFNDWKCEARLSGDTDSKDPFFFEGAVNILIDRCREAYPNARILFFIPWVTGSGDNYSTNTSLDYICAMKEICEKKGISYFPAYDPTISGIDVSSETFMAEHFNGDSWHMNEAGHSMMLEKVVAWTEACLNEETAP